MTNPPLLSPLFDYSAPYFRYKPAPDYPTWVNAWDATPLIAADVANAASAAAAQSTATSALALATSAASYLPDNALLVPMNFRTLVGGFTAPVLQAGQHFGQYSTLTANGDRAVAIVSLDAKTYTLEVSYIKGSNLGRLNITVDAGTPLTLDQYNATTLLSQRSVTSLGALAAGNHVIEVGVSGKNGSSSGFNCHVSYLAIRQS